MVYSYISLIGYCCYIQKSLSTINIRKSVYILPNIDSPLQQLSMLYNTT